MSCSGERPVGRPQQRSGQVRRGEAWNQDSGCGGNHHEKGLDVVLMAVAEVRRMSRSCLQEIEKVGHSEPEESWGIESLVLF